jgi:hypothetical protein
MVETSSVFRLFFDKKYQPKLLPITVFYCEFSDLRSRVFRVTSSYLRVDFFGADEKFG